MAGKRFTALSNLSYVTYYTYMYCTVPGMLLALIFQSKQFMLKNKTPQILPADLY